MKIKLVSSDSVEPVTLTEVANHLRLDLTHTYSQELNEEQYVRSLITAARVLAENLTGRAFTNQVWAIYLDSFPEISEVKLIKPPVYDVIITYKDVNDDDTLLSPDTYVISNDYIPRIFLRPGESWPATYEGVDKVQIIQRCGMYRNATELSPPGEETPEVVKLWIMMKVGEFYENRERSNTDKVTEKTFIDSLLDPIRIREFYYEGW